MKIWALFPVAVCSLTLSATAAINSASQEIVRMANSGVSQDVIQQYVNGSAATFNLNADDILYLQQNGVPQPIISTMISHDNAIAQGNGNTQPDTSYTQQPQNYQQAQPQDYQQTQPIDQTVQQGQVNPPDVYGGQDQQVMQVAPNQAPPQVTAFYDDLRPYGNWIYLEGSGWCWQPNEVRTVANWQPYSDNGNWLYSNDGWYWQSYYNWGWAPFHYGRWAHANCGWVWYPDTVWAPSWVCWRNTGDYCGWAPLPPSGFYGYGRAGFHFGVDFNIGLGAGLFTFIHMGDIFHGGHGYGYRHYEVPRYQATQIYNRSRVINNVTVVNNNYARNPGISRQTVERVAGPVRVTPVRTTTQDPRASRPGVVGSGNQAAIVRPQQISAPTRSTPIVGHRLPANARTVPATTPAINNRVSPQQNRNTNLRQGTTTSTHQPLTTPRSSDYGRRTTPTQTQPQRTPTVGEVPRTTNPRVNELPRTSNPQVHEVPRTTQQPRVTETPRPTTHPTTEVAKPTPHVSEVPKPAPHVSEVPKPAPHVTEVPHSAPARTVSPSQSELHRAYPQAAPRAQAPTVHEPAGSRAPAPVPHAAAPMERAAPAPHVSAPAPHPAPAPHVESHSAPAPASHENPGHDGRQDH